MAKPSKLKKLQAKGSAKAGYGSKKDFQKQMKGGQFRLGKKEKEIVREAICKKAKLIDEIILAISVWSNHVHIVSEYSGRPIEETVRIYKNTASAAIKGSRFKGRIWTRGFDKRFCFDNTSLEERIKYVKGHK